MDNLKTKVLHFIKRLDPLTLKILKTGNMLPSLIKNFLIVEILKDISIEKNIYDNEINIFYSKNKLNNKYNLNKLLKAKGINKEELNYQITLDLKINKFAEENFKKELQDYFLQQKEFLDEYTFNILRVNDSYLAKELYFQIDSEESDFNKLSQSYSFYSSLYPKGIFGPTNLKGFNPIIKNKLINATIGNLMHPFEVDNWWLIIKLIEKKDAKLDTMTSKMLLKEIFDKFINKLLKNFIEDSFSIN